MPISITWLMDGVGAVSIAEVFETSVPPHYKPN